MRSFLLLRSFILVLLLGLAAGKAAAQAGPLLGNWSFLWEGANGQYTGTLAVTKQMGNTLYGATLTVIRSDGYTVKQEANIVVTGKEIRIECFNPSVSTWSPDRFYVTLSGDAMEGYSLDSAGQRGRRIAFKRM